MTTNTKAANERELAVDLLLAVTRDGEHSHVALGEVLEKYEYIGKQKRAFLTRLVMGTLERMLELDFVIDQFSKTPVKKMKPMIRAILRSGTYQLLYMDSVPASAACNEAVRLTGRRGFSSLKGFVNGVLRAISRAKEAGDIIYPDKSKEPLQYLSVKASMPQWLLKLWIEDYGYDTVWRMCEELLLPRATAIRVNTGAISPEELCEELEESGVQAFRTKLFDALLISGYDHLSAIPAFVRGDFYVQDLSTMQAILAAGIKKDWHIIDVCAAPGGKSIHAAQLMEGTGHVQARDISEYKADLIRENLMRTRTENVSVKVWDATVLDEASIDSADLVIADLPCSGLGVLHGKPEIKYRMSREQMDELARLQRQILSVVSSYVKPGGRLLFSTCTISRMENEENTAWFARKYPHFSLQKQLRILPDRQHDGFYYAIFDRKE